MAAAAFDPCDVVERLFRLRGDGRIEEVVDLFAPEMNGTSLADGASYRSREDIRQYVERELQGERRSEVTCSRMLQHGDRVLVEGRMRLHDRRGLSDSPAVWVFRVQDGLIAEVEPFSSMRAALASHPAFAGSSSPGTG